MGKRCIFTARMAVILILHAAGVGLASPTVLVTRSQARLDVEWLPNDNQTLYKLQAGETKSLELNTTNVPQTSVFITISPCTEDIRWSLYHGKTYDQGSLTLLKNYVGVEMKTFSVFAGSQDRYILQLSTSRDGSAAVSVRGEATKLVRLRLRTRSRRRLVANWDPSPIDPQSTSYCVVASHSKNYTSFCAAQCDLKSRKLDNISVVRSINNDQTQHNRSKIDCSDMEFENKIKMDSPSVFGGGFKTLLNKKFGRSTKANNEDPVIACVGERTHHFIENLEPTKMYYVSVFGVASDRHFGSLLANGVVRPRTSTAKRLKENVPDRADIRGRAVYYFKTDVGARGGIWLVIIACGGAVDVEVLVRGKKLYMAKNIESYSKFFVPTPIPNSSIQDVSDEGSIQLDSSSEEARVRYMMKISPSKWDRDRTVNVQVVASTSRWGMNIPELSEDGSVVRELRPKRSCRSLDIAFLPATHNTINVIRYCVAVRESGNGRNIGCLMTKKYLMKNQCFNRVTWSPTKVIVQKIIGLRPGRKYAIQVTAAAKGSPIPYKLLYANTYFTCNDDIQ